MLYNTLHDTLPLNVMISGKCFYGLGMAITRFHHQCFCFGCEILHNTKKEKEKENFVSYFVFFWGNLLPHFSKNSFGSYKEKHFSSQLFIFWTSSTNLSPF